MNQSEKKLDYLLSLGLVTVAQINSIHKENKKVVLTKLNRKMCNEIFSMCPFSILVVMPNLKSSIDAYFNKISKKNSEIQNTSLISKTETQLKKVLTRNSKPIVFLSFFSY